MGIDWDNLEPSLKSTIQGAGLSPGTAEKHYACLSTGAARSYWDARVPGDRSHATISAAHSGITTGRNDAVILSQDSHTQSSALTWSKNCSQLIGAGPPTLMNHRARIGHDANFDALLTVSGYGNLLANFYTMHGRGSATNLHNVEVTGNRNVFKNVHLGGPMHATEAGTAGYSTLELNGAQECLFEDSTFGIDTIERSAANTVLRIGGIASRNIFRRCTFLSMSSAATPYFIEILSTATFGWTRFEDCTFINYSSSWATPLTVGCLNGSADGQHRLIFSGVNNGFFGVTDVIAADKEGSVLVGLPTYTAAATSNLLSGTADHT